MRRRDLFKATSLCLLQGLDPAGFRRVMGKGNPRLPGRILVSLRDVDSPVALSPDGRWVATCEKDCLFKVWDGATGALLWTEPKPGPMIRSLAFSHDGRRLVTGGHAGWKEVEWPSPETPGDRNPFDRSMSAPGPEGCRVKTWDLMTKRSSLIIDNRDGIGINHVAFVGGADDVVAIDFAGRLFRWGRGGRAVAPRVVDLPQRPGEALCPRFVAIDGDGHSLAAIHELRQDLPFDPALEPSTRIRLVDLPSGKLRILDNAGATIWSIAISRDGTRVATGNGNGDGIVTIWDYSQGKAIHRLPSEDGRGIPFVAFSPDGAELVTGTQRGDLRLWDCAQGRLIRSIAGPASQARAIAFLGDRRRLVSGGVKHSEPDPVTKETPLEPLVLWDDQDGLS